MKRKIKFGLRTLFVVTAIVAVILFVFMNLRGKENRRQFLVSDEGRSQFPGQLQSYSSSGEEPPSFSLSRTIGLVGGDASETAIYLVSFPAGTTTESIEETINLFPEIQHVNFHFSVATIENISILRGLEFLKQIQVNDARIGFNEMSEIGRLPQRPEISFHNIHLDDKFLIDAVNSDICLYYIYSPTSKVSDDGLSSVAKLKSLISLLLDDCPISNEGVEALKNHPALRYIYLDNCRVGDSIVPTLQSIPKLYQLSLRGTDLTDEGAKMLIPIAGSLSELDIRNTNVTDAGVGELSPTCRLGVLKH